MRKIIYTTGFKAPIIKVGEENAKAWVDYRYAYWNRYTKQSILNQNNPDWEYWLIVNVPSFQILGPDRLAEITSDDRFKIVFRDDQLAAFKDAQGDYDYYMVLRLDSDDMYRDDVTDEMLSIPVSDEDGLYRYVQYQRGYVYKPRNKKLKEWWRRHMTPPFFAMIYTRQVWEEKIRNGDGGLFDGGHEQVRVHRRKLLPDGRFCVGVHDLNMVTTIGKRTEIIDEALKKEILARFGVDYPEVDFLTSDVHDLLGLIPGGWEKTKNE